MTDRVLGLVAVGDRGVGACDVSTGQVQRVFGRLEQRDGTPEVLERELRPGLLERDPTERPEEPHPRVRVGDLLRGCGDL